MVPGAPGGSSRPSSSVSAGSLAVGATTGAGLGRPRSFGLAEPARGKRIAGRTASAPGLPYVTRRAGHFYNLWQDAEHKPEPWFEIGRDPQPSIFQCADGLWVHSMHFAGGRGKDRSIVWEILGIDPPDMEWNPTGGQAFEDVISAAIGRMQRQDLLDQFWAHEIPIAPVRHAHEALERHEQVLFEGAQATFLDLDHGTYPFVTSSNTVSGTAASGSGLGPSAAGFVLGIVKAYTTRVGSGPFPTELEDAIGQRLGERGHEFGTVTGRKRRCGWFDAVLTRQSCAISGVTGIALTKLDVLDGFETVKICIGYKLTGKDGVTRELDYFPSHAADQAAVVPVYEEMPGWSETTAGARSWAQLPAQAIKYIQRVQELIETPVALVSTSPEREDTILVRDPFVD